jgi:hypothetical protein
MSSHIELRQGQAEIIQRLDAQQAQQASSKAYSEATLQSPHTLHPPSPETNTVNVYSPPPPDWPFGPGFPFNRVSSPGSYHSPTPPSPQPMIHRGNSYNSGNVVVTNVVNSNNDYSNNFHQYSHDYSMPPRGVYIHRSSAFQLTHDP